MACSLGGDIGEDTEEPKGAEEEPGESKETMEAMSQFASLPIS